MREQSNEAGEEAIRYLLTFTDIPAVEAKECLELLIANRKKIPLNATEKLVTGLLRECPGARKFLAKRLSESATLVFGEMYELGDGSANALTAVVLDTVPWSDEKVREDAEKDVFRLFLAKLLEVGHDHDGKALKGIARLLATDPERLHSLIDEETFDAVLSSLDNRLPIDVRTQATMASAKFLESSQANGHMFFLNFIQYLLARQKSEDLILAFSAAAAVFPLNPSVASSFFLTEGFVPSLVPLVDKKVKSERVQQALLELLSAACLDSACRQAIQKHCTQWLHGLVDGLSEQSASLATVILAKMQGSKGQATKNEGEHDDRADIVRRMKQMIMNSDLSGQDASTEGLAYASSRPEVKEQIVKDSKLIEVLVQRLDATDRSKADAPQNSIIAFGILTILDNLTRYLPTLSEEQRKMSQLKAYAHASPSSAAPSPLDSEAAVKKRGEVLITGTPIVSNALNPFISIPKPTKQGQALPTRRCPTASSSIYLHRRDHSRRFPLPLHRLPRSRPHPHFR